MTYKAISTKGSKLAVSISSTLTDIPGVENFSINNGEEAVWEDGNLLTDFDTLQATGVGGGASISGTLWLDPLDAVHQFLQTCKNNGGVPSAAANVVGKAHLGASGVIWDWTGILTKWDAKAERKSGWSVDFEFKIDDRMDLNEADPT